VEEVEKAHTALRASRVDVKQFETWSDMGFRQAIDSSSLFREVIRVRKALREENSSQLRARLNSLTKVLEEAERLNRALRLGDTSPKMVGLLGDWALAGEDRMVLGFEALHAYLVMAGARFKRSKSTKFNLHEQRGLEALLRRAVDAGKLQLNSSEQVVFTKTGRMGLMRVLNPLSFVEFKNWVATQPGRSASQLEQDQQQVDAVEGLIAAGLLSATYDQYE